MFTTMTRTTTTTTSNNTIKPSSLLSTTTKTTKITTSFSKNNSTKSCKIHQKQTFSKVSLVLLVTICLLFLLNPASSSPSSLSSSTYLSPSPNSKKIMPLLPEKIDSSAFIASSSSASASTTTTAFVGSRSSTTTTTTCTTTRPFASPYPSTTYPPPPLPPATAALTSPYYTTSTSHALLGGRGSMPTFLLSSVACNDGIMTVSRTYQKKESLSDDEKEEDIQNNIITNNFNLHYRIFRPRSLSSMKHAPIIVLHGGPSVPSDYIYPLVDVVPYRSIVYYDQIGCGRSDTPTDVEAYSISNAIDDLEQLIKKLGIRRFHLYGQSFGGILAFEYLKRVAERKKTNEDDDEGCLSVIISSTPTSVSLVEKTANDLLEQIKSELEKDKENKDEEEEDDDETSHDPQNNQKKILETFRTRHQCRTPSMPQPLIDAYAHAGTVWRGTTAIPNYVAKPPSENAPNRMPSAMIMRGEYDFVTQDCMGGWKGDGLFKHKFVREVVLAGCAHHGLLENPGLYGDVVESFMAEYD